MKIFDYTICNCADTLLFKKQCIAIEQGIMLLTKEPLLEDVDGSLVQKYYCPQGNIVVKNDQQVDVLYVQSDFDLRVYFTND
jgi:hypothetical protein